jgi:ABC-2 type transport system permease protein
MSGFANTLAILRREFLVRVRTRSYVIGTVLLIAGVVAIALVPVVVRAIDQPEGSRIGVHRGAPDLASDIVPTLGALLNATAGGGEPLPVEASFVVTEVVDLAAARESVNDGDLTAVLAIDRAPDGEPRFTLYTNESATGRTAQLVGQATTALVIRDRLDRLGVDPGDQATLFAPASYAVAWADPDRDDPTQDGADQAARYFLGFGMTILIFMMIVLYGNWVAMSVVEEKSSRVMEVILNAATPFQLMAGKVLGVGAVALTQYVAIIVAGVLALLAQEPIARLVLGGTGDGISLPQGLDAGMLGLLGIYGVLGFLLYAVLYAAAGSLVSRQEDVNQAVMPMTLISAAGYFVGVYAATGLFDMGAGWMRVLAQVPFLSPFLMLSRVTGGEAAPWEVALSVGLLVVAILVALWIAARIYAAGVLMYGQRPGIRAIWRLFRTGM